AVRCSCGIALDVPTMRGLKELERAESLAPARSTTWGGRQRAIFALLVILIGSLLAAGYMRLSLPLSLEPPELPEINENSPLADVYAVYQDALQGLHTQPLVWTPEEQTVINARKYKLWGIKVALTLAGCALAGAVLVMLSGRKQK